MGASLREIVRGKEDLGTQRDGLPSNEKKGLEERVIGGPIN